MRPSLPSIAVTKLPLLGYFARRVRDPELAADLAAEVFAAMLVGCRRYRSGNAPAHAWLFGIAEQKLVDSLRRGRVEDRTRRRLHMPPLELTDEAVERIERLSEADGLALRLVEELPVAQREAVVARIIEERSYPEVAARL